MLTQFVACNAKETANNTVSTVNDKAKDTASSVKDKANDAASAVKDKANDAASAVKDKANDAASTVKDKAIQAKEYVVDWYNQIDMTKFKDGWDSAVDFASSKYAAAMGGMVASAGFSYAKEIVLEIKDGDGFEAVVPAGVVDTMNVISDKVADLKLMSR